MDVKAALNNPFFLKIINAGILLENKDVKFILLIKIKLYALNAFQVITFQNKIVKNLFQTAINKIQVFALVVYQILNLLVMNVFL
jgi:hypothetical protein